MPRPTAETQTDLLKYVRRLASITGSDPKPDSPPRNRYDINR